MTETTTLIDRRTTIIEAALEVFSQYGFDAGTTRQIADRAGVAEGLLYRYFDSKQDLLCEAVRSRSALPWLEESEDTLIALSAAEGIRHILIRALDRMDDNSGPFMVMWSQLATNETVAQNLGGFIKEALQRITDFLEAKMAAGELRGIDTEVASQMIMGSLVMYTLRTRHLSPPLALLPRQRFIDGVVDLLTGGQTSATGGDDEQV